MNEQALDLVLSLRAVLKVRLGALKHEVKYWHKEKKANQSLFLEHCARIRYQHSLRSLIRTFNDLREVNQIIKELENASE